MSPKNYSSDLARFGQPLSFDSLVGNAPANPVLEAKSAVVSNKAEQAKQTIEMSAGAKALMFGSPNQQRVVATAYIEGNRLADTQVQDAYELSTKDFTRKYGVGSTQNRQNIRAPYEQVAGINSAQRLETDVAKDTALDVAGGLASTAGGTLALGAEALDWAVDLPGRAINTALGTELVPNVPSAGPAISAATQQARDFLQEQQSPILQAKREQMAIVNELDAVDRNEEFEGEEGVVPWFRKQGRAAFETVENYVEDPAMFGSVSAEAIGSLAVSTKLINSAGKALAMRKLSKKNMTRKEAQAYLKTDEGKVFLNKAKLAAVMPVSSVVEGGGAVTQAQQEILAMDEATLRESAEYNALREKMGHEEARYRLASDGGKAAAIVGTILGGVTGRFSRQFEVSPWGLPGTGKLGSSIAKGAKIGAIETLEEGVQEGSNQFGANVGVASIGLDRDLDKGLGEAVGEGLVGGFGMASVIAGPSAAAGTVGEIGRGIKSRVVTAVENANQKIRDGGATGLNAQMDAAVSIAQADTDIAAIPETERAAPVELVQAQDKASYLSVEESAAVVQAFPALKSEGTDDRVSRASLVVALSDALGSEKTPEEVKPQLAIGLIESYDQLRQLGSDKARAQIKSLPEGSQERTLYESKLEALKIVESNGAMKQAKEIIGKLTETDMQSMLDFSDIDQGKFDTDKSRSTLETLEVVGRYKPQSVTPEDYSRVLDQVEDEATRERLETSKALVTSFAKAYEGREKLGFTEAQKQTRQDIYFNNNHTNSGKSLVAHNADVMETHSAGKTQDALDNLTELYEFARSMSNKIQGMNESKNEYNGKPVPFESWNPNSQTRFMQDAKGQMSFLVPGNEASVLNAIETSIDANLAGELYNTLYERLSKDLTAEQMANFEPITITTLDLPSSTRIRDWTLADIIQTDADFNATTPERRLRRDAVLKNSEALIDRGTKPVRVITQSEKRKLTKRAGGKQPFTKLLASMGGVDPKSPLGVELRQGRNLTRRDLRGLFKDNGQTEFDNLPAKDYDPVLVAEIGTDDNGYLNFDGIIEALVRESTGQDVITTSDMLDARESLAAVEEQELQNEQAQNELAEAEDAIALRGLIKVISGSTGQSDANTEEASTESRSSTVKKKSTLKEMLVNLVKNSDGLNYFLEVFRLKSRDVSLLAQDNPFSYAIEQTKMSENARSVMKAFARNDMPELKGKMDVYLTKQFNAKRNKDQKGDSLAESWAKGKDVLKYDSAHILNMGKITDNKITMDPKLFSAGMMATIEWLIKADATGITKPSDKNLAKFFGLESEADVTTQHRKLYLKGVKLQNAVDEISQGMENLLGVQADRNQEVLVTQGMFRNVATSMLQVMDQENLLTVNANTVYSKDESHDFYLDQKGKKTYYFTVTLNKKGPFKEKFLDGVKGYPDLFKSVYAPDTLKTRYIGKPPSKLTDAIIRQKSNKLSRTQRKAVERLQKVKHNIVVPMFQLSESMDEQSFLKLFGFEELDGKVWNIADRTAIEGRNRNLADGLKGVRGYVEQMREQYDDDDFSTPIFFDWFISSVGRLQQQGPVTPQGSKVARELISATQSVLNLNNSEHMEALKLAIYQSMDLKVGIEKQSTEASIAKIDALIEGDYAKVIQMMESWVRTGDINGPALVEAFNEAGIEKSAKAVHAMMTVARMNFYVENQEDVSAFETSLALEYDGKTDGPINAMINMASGLFTPHQIKVMAKGGLFLGVNQPVSLNDYIGGNKALGLEGDDVDLYILASEMLEKNLYRDFQNTNIPEKMNAALRTLSTFSSNFDFSYDEDGLNISVFRNMVKNPLTVFIYGSSENGIAGKIAAEVMGNLRKTMSEVADAVSRDEYGSYLEHPAFKGTGLADILKSIDPEVTKLLENPETETGDFFAASLTNLFNLTIAEPMIEALDDATGGLRANMQLLQATASVQAYIFSDVYTKMLEEKKAELGVKGSRNLSESTLREVFEEASKVAPIYVSGAQEFRVAEADGYTSDETVSTGMNGKLASGADLPRPGNPSVKISPFLIIGTGDGMMMMNIYTGELQDFDRNLPVFDGIEDNLENIKRNAEYINQKVLDGWLTEDVPGMALRSFNQTIRYLRSGSLSKETTANIAKTYKSLNKSRQNQKGAKFIRSHKDLYGELTTMAGENKARKKAMATFSMSGDHMAGANAPAFRDGARVGITGYNPQAVSVVINTVYLEIREDQRKDAQAKQRAPATATFEKGFGKRLMNISTETGISGTRRVQGDALVEVLEKSNLSSEQEQVFLDVMRKDPAFKEYSFIFGSSENVTAVRDRDFPNLKDHNGKKPGPVQMGQVITDKKVAYISNVSSETVLHEILHTYTAQRIEDYYADTKEDKHIPAYMVQAFTRLEKLMADFRSMTFDQVTNNAEDKAGLLLQRVLDNAENDPVGQMSEFLSWTMTNQNLINIGKETEVRSPLAKIAYTAVRLLKRILGIQGDPGTNMFSNIRFNMDVISNLPVVENLAEEDARTRTIFDQVYGTDDNLTELENKYMTRLKAYLSRISDTPAAEQRRVVDLLQQADKAIVDARAVGFTLNDREAATFRAIHATMASGMQLNGSVLRQVKRAYAVALKEAPDNAQWGFLAGRGVARQTKSGQTDLLATFAALAQVNNVLRADLAKIDTPNIQTETNPNMGTVDQWMKWAGDQIVNWLTKLSISRKPLGNTAQMQLDALAGALVEIEDGRRLRAEELVYKASQAVNETLAKGIEKVSVKTSRKLQNMRSGIKIDSVGKYVSTSLEIASLITAFGSKSEMSGKIKAIEEHMNKTPKLRELRALMNDFVGVTDENAETLKIMNQVRSGVDAVRQEYREQVPEVLASKFNRKLDNDEWTEMQRAVGYTDVVALGIDETLALMKDPSTLPTMKRQLEAEVNSLGGKRAVRYKQKARVLAKNLANRTKASNNMQRNAYAIAKLAGETNRVKGKVDEKLVKAIDKLTSLYAYEELTPEQKDKMKDLMETEPTGMRFVIGYQDTVRGLENHRLSKMNNAKVARINGYKGHSSTIIRDGHAIVVADDANGEDRRRKGYERVGSYYGDGSENIDHSVGYYVSTVGGKATFRQGTMQTVHETWNGVDPRTGFTQNKPMGGVIKGRKAQRVLNARGPVRDNLDSKEALLPVYDESGKTIAFERSIDPEKMEHLQVDEHMGRMLGVSMGRLFEEDLANKFNMILLQEMKRNYDIGVRTGTLDQFVNIAESDDPIHKDIWKTLGVRLKDDAAAIFGEEKLLPVKRSMELDTVGYRAGSVREVWDDNSRMNKTFQKAFQDALVLPFGEKAYKRAVQGETLVQDAVSYAKTTIVVRSVVVMKENLVSNVLHLMSWGIGPVQALKGIVTKFLETNQYVKNRERILELNAELAATGQNRKARERISAQIKVLTDIEKNLSIYPLIAAGEFNTISESLTEADTAIANGKLSNLIEQYADRLPGLARDAVKTLMITRDSALFKALNRAVQYGDFTAKAVLYDHLTDQQNMDPDAAMKVITEEFVNYNRLAGRGRDYAESMGMLWFTSYKIRIMKILAKMARERPANALLYGAGVGPWLDIDTVASGSFAGSVADGGFSYAVGPEMGIDSLSMNPFWGGIAN